MLEAAKVINKQIIQVLGITADVPDIDIVAGDPGAVLK